MSHWVDDVRTVKYDNAKVDLLGDRRSRPAPWTPSTVFSSLSGAIDNFPPAWTGTSDVNHATVMTDASAVFVAGTLVDQIVYNTTTGFSAVITGNAVTTITVAALGGGGWHIGDEYTVGHTLLIPITTYAFGDSPNKIQISNLVIESMSANGVYILEFSYKLPTGFAFVILGAIRFTRTSVQVRSFELSFPARAFNIDTYGLYARLKGSVAAMITTYSFSVARYQSPSWDILASTGVFPYG